MRIDTSYITPVLWIDETDISEIENKGLDPFFEDLKKSSVFDIDACQYYNGEVYFVYASGDIVCYACMKEQAETGDIGDSLSYISFLIEDPDQTYYCQNCGTVILPLYESDE